jgi:phage shock protein C
MMPISLPTDTALPANQGNEPLLAAQPDAAERQLALPLRNDTILGVCEAIGEDFGFHANWLRVALAVTVVFSPYVALAIYGALGLAVLLSRLLYPAPRALAAPRDAASPAQRTADNQTAEELLAA